MSAVSVTREAYASTRQTAARALLEGASLDASIAEILRAISSDLDWPLALYWVVAPESGALRCRSIWAADALKRADLVEASRVAVIPAAAAAKDDLAGRAFEGREPIWIESLPSAGTAPGSRAALAIAAGLEAAAAFPIADNHGSVGAIELYALRARPSDPEMVAMMAEIGHEICEVFRRAEAQTTAHETMASSRDALSLVLGTIPPARTVLDAQRPFM